jgi:ABC-type cobalamin transport system permease subunit
VVDLKEVMVTCFGRLEGMAWHSHYLATLTCVEWLCTLLCTIDTVFQGRKCHFDLWLILFCVSISLLVQIISVSATDANPLSNTDIHN